MRKFDSGLKLPAKTARTPLKIEILWGCESGGRNQFPTDVQTIHARRHSLDPTPMNAFRNAVMRSVDRVWVVDEYFLTSDKGARADARIMKILEWLHDGLIASDIRILTKKHDEVTENMLRLFEDRELTINASQTRRSKKCRIQVCTRLNVGFNYMHDRFAIVDDELWHFGATVGGFHPSVNAASRGWDAVDSGAIEFFELAWRKCEER